MKKIAIITLLFILFLPQLGFGKEVLRLATTTSTYETGLLDYILPPFEERYNLRIHIVSVGTGKAIRLGENGDVDVILVHAKELEEKFIEDGYGIDRRSVMYNDFLILGPEEDPAKISGLEDIREAFRSIYSSEYTFVSRGDDSGTDRKEKELWLASGIDPEGEWYLETGQGMNATLRIADERNAYIMLDRATYLFNKDRIRLRKLIERYRDLFNPYSVIAVNPRKHLHVKYDLAIALIEWLTSPECQQMINDYNIDGNQLFHADQ